MYLVELLKAFIGLSIWLILVFSVGKLFRLKGIFAILVGEVIIGYISLFSGLLFRSNVNVILTILTVCCINILKWKEFVLTCKKLNLITLFIFTAVVLPLCVPVDWDDVAYHNPILKELANGQIKFPLLKTSPYLDYYKPFSVFYGSLPYLSESISLFPYWISFNLNLMPNLVNAFNFCLLILLIWKFLVPKYNLNLLNIILILCFTLLWNPIFKGFATGTSDINVVLFLLASIYMLKSRFSKNLEFSAFFVSCAFAMKYSAIYFLPIYIILFLQHKPSIYRYFSAVAVFLVPNSFWYIKNVVLYGNLVYPLWFSQNILPEGWNKLIIDTQIGFKTALTFFNYIRYIKLNYLTDISVITIISIFVLIIKGKSHFQNLNLLLIAIMINIINFYFGSQIIRFELLSYVLILIVFFNNVNILPKNAFFLIFALLIYGFSSNKAAIMSKAAYYASFINGGSYSVIDKAKGCFSEVEYILSQAECMGCALNPWDPYAALTTKMPSKFTTLDNNINLNHVRYIYINRTFEKAFINDSIFHRDINVEYRMNSISNLIIKHKQMYLNDQCILYTL